MKRVLLSLWVLGGVLYAASTLVSTNTVNLFGREGEPKPIAGDVAPAASPNLQIAAVEPPQTGPAGPALNDAADSPHAISPDGPALEARAPAEPPLVDKTAENRVPAVEAAQAPPAPSLPETEILKLKSAASIRKGPSSSAEIIGTAEAGTEARVVSRDSGWVQIVDPQSGRSGWIYAALAAPSAPADAATETLPPKEVAGETVAKPSDKRQKTKAFAQSSRSQEASTPAKQRSRARQLPSDYVELPSDEAFVPMRRLGKKRILQEGALPPWNPYRFDRW
jgi:Bacterial SH3 domain